MPLFTRRAARLTLALAAASLLAACAETAVIPLVDGSPNPAPVPGYRVVCDTDMTGSPFWFARSGCRPVVGEPAPRTVLRAKG